MIMLASAEKKFLPAVQHSYMYVPDESICPSLELMNFLLVNFPHCTEHTARLNFALLTVVALRNRGEHDSADIFKDKLAVLSTVECL